MTAPALLPRCPACRRVYQTVDSLCRHLIDDHSTKVLAEELIKALGREASARRALTQEQACGKVRYGTEEAASQALLAAWRSRSTKRRELRSYLCERCGGYHLSSRPADTDEGLAAS